MDHDRSRTLFARAQRSLAGGVSSGFRKNQQPVPLYFTDGVGPRVRDVDGNHYIDYVLAWGPQILGHSHPAVVAAVQQQVARGQTFGAQCELEIQVAEAICRLVPGCQRVAFSNTGSEAVQVALRLARAFTGRPKIIKFEGHYHGWMDNVLWSFRHTPGAPDPRGYDDPVAGTAGQLASAGVDIITLPWNDLALCERVLDDNEGEIAGIITEPLLANTGMIPASPGFIEGLRTLCDERDVVLIFDEVITGFRVAPGGARDITGVIPDLSVYGKALAGGFPMSAVGGRGDILDLIANQKVVHAGTLNGNPVCLAAALATLEELGRDNGAALASASRFGEELQRELQAACARYGVPLLIQGVGSVFWTFFTDAPAIDSYAAFAGYDGRRYREFALRLLHEGVLLMDSGRWYVSTAHAGDELADTARAFDRVLASGV